MGDSILEETFAIVDIETTGGSACRDRITEIAIISMQGWRETRRCCNFCEKYMQIMMIP